MAIKRRAVALVFAVLLAAGLVSCGDAGSASSEPLEEAVYMVDVQQPFTGYLARDAAELEDIAADAVKLAKDRKAGIAEDAEETDLAAEVNPEFNLANECYADGSYEKAEKLYRSIIDTYPQHYGANVNLTLALLHQEKNEEALVQALSCIELAPGEEGIFLNIQTAGVACGFATEDLEVAMDATLDGLGRGTYGAGSGYDEEYGPLYRYNKLWSRIETELAVAGDGEDAEAASTDELAEGSFAYDALESELDGLAGELSGDSDAAALRTYLYAVGLQLGYRADPTLVGPMHTMPYVAVDSDICTIEVKKLEKDDDGWALEFVLTNKTEDQMTIGRGALWLVNGEEVRPYLSEVVLEPADTRDLKLELTAYGDASGQDAASLMGTFYITSRSKNSVLAAYPISWEGAA